MIKEYVLGRKIRNNDNNIIYYIEENGGNTGFFGILRDVLVKVSFAERFGWIPYIKYGTTLYTENCKINNTNNMFEYFFEQPVYKLSIKDIISSNLICSKINDFEVQEMMLNKKKFSYEVGPEYIKSLAPIYNKYFVLNKKTDYYISKKMNEIIGSKRTLGVHIRGTDFYKQFNNHPVPVKVEKYVNIINDLVSEYNYEQVFIATDDIRCLEQIKNQIFIRCVYYKNVKRNKTNRSVAFIEDSRKNNKFRLGLEVLTDAYTLAKCDGFVGCLSQIDIAVQIIKASRNESFDYIEIINDGIVKNNRECWEPRN